METPPEELPRVCHAAENRMFIILTKGDLAVSRTFWGINDKGHTEMTDVELYTDSLPLPFTVGAFI